MTDWAETARTRQGLYRFFGGALIAPDDQRVESLTAAADLLESLGLEQYAFYPQWRLLVAAIANRPEVDMLRSHYVRLFAAGVDASFCPPTESYYSSDAKGGSMADLVAQLVREYRALGLATDESSEAPDHVATQLEVMSALCAREASAWEAGVTPTAVSALSDQTRFLRRHLAIWFPTFRRRVRDATPGEFYGSLVEAAHAYVVHDVDFIRELRHAAEAMA